jgi:hypothetical protein
VAPAAAIAILAPASRAISARWPAAAMDERMPFAEKSSRKMIRSWTAGLGKIKEWLNRQAP